MAVEFNPSVTGGYQTGTAGADPVKSSEDKLSAKAKDYLDKLFNGRLDAKNKGKRVLNHAKFER